MAFDAKLALEEFGIGQKAYRRSLIVFTVVLFSFIPLFIAILAGAVVAFEQGLIPASAVPWIFLADAVIVYVSAGRIATWASNRVLRKAGVKP